MRSARVPEIYTQRANIREEGIKKGKRKNPRLETIRAKRNSGKLAERCFRCRGITFPLERISSHSSHRSIRCLPIARLATQWCALTEVFRAIVEREMHIDRKIALLGAILAPWTKDRLVLF
jgi:hypothetical protein